eukprot:scaffold60057_cov20-Tisochrysis_lutea.AAC.3
MLHIVIQICGTSPYGWHPVEPGMLKIIIQICGTSPHGWHPVEPGIEKRPDLQAGLAAYSACCCTQISMARTMMMMMMLMMVMHRIVVKGLVAPREQWRQAQQRLRHTRGLSVFGQVDGRGAAVVARAASGDDGHPPVKRPMPLFLNRLPSLPSPLIHSHFEAVLRQLVREEGDPAMMHHKGEAGVKGSTQD